MFQFRRFPTYGYLIHRTLPCGGFPHSEISGSKLICSSPKLIAACHVLHRLLMPRHSPCALISLTISGSQRIMRLHRRIFYRSNCSCYPIIPQYLFQTAFAALPSVALLLLFFSLFSFQGAVPVKDRIKTLKGSLSVLIHSSMVEISGIEPLTSCVQSRRSPG